ncbi:MAG: IS1096 element passenger TnpR family protein [Bacteroidia bacterium]
MAVYKFRLSFEDYEDVHRDIEIKSSQTLVDFHEMILQSVGFDMKHAASFFVSDDFWRKGQEITLLQEDIEPGVKLMKNVKVSSVIERPNQRLIYLYDKQALWSFQLELIKLVSEDVTANYPRCTKSTGQAPKQYKQQLLDKLKKEVEEDIVLDKLSHDDESDRKRIKSDEKLVFDEKEMEDLHEDENDLVTGGDEEEEDQDSEEGGEENENESEGGEQSESW